MMLRKKKKTALKIPNWKNRGGLRSKVSRRQKGKENSLCLTARSLADYRVATKFGTLDKYIINEITLQIKI